MKRKEIHDWILATAPAFCWLLLRYAVRNGSSVMESLLTASVLIGSAWEIFRLEGTEAFRLHRRACLQWLLMGLICGALNRLLATLPDFVPADRSWLLMCILAPAAEELIYRGLVYHRCLRFLPEKGAILVNTLLFAAAHGSPARMVIAFLAGLLFSTARKRTGTVTVPVLLHISMNAAVFLF